MLYPVWLTQSPDHQVQTIRFRQAETAEALGIVKSDNDNLHYGYLINTTLEYPATFYVQHQGRMESYHGVR